MLDEGGAATTCDHCAERRGGCFCGDSKESEITLTYEHKVTPS
jgi:hypothetical protein